MTATPTAATPTPEELARQIATPDGLTFKDKDGLRTAIAAAIRQHSEALRAEIERLTKERDEAEGTISELPRLIAVIGKLTGAPMDDPAGYGLDDCVAMLEEHEAAVAGIGWQIGLTGETERADRAEKRIAAAVSDASRHERLWRAAMRGTAAYRALLAASQERERGMREALTMFTKSRYQITDRGPANTWSLDRLHEAWVRACDCLSPAPHGEKQ